MTRPAIAAAAPWRFPIPEISTLANGMTLAMVHLPGQHLAAVELVLPAPLEAEARTVEGVATVALGASFEATTDRPDIVEELELQAAAVGGAAVWGHTHLNLSAPTWRLPKALELFASVATRPAFLEADLAHHVEAQVAAFETRLASPTAVTQQALRTALYGEDTREGRPLAGTPETLGAIDQASAHAWHAAAWQPKGATLIVAGDLTGFHVAQVAAPFETWSAGSTPRRAGDAEPLRPRVLLVDLPLAAQTVIQVAASTPGRDHPDWAALKLGGHAMCGAFASRANLELRERLGYTYGVSGGVTARRVDGIFRVGAAVDTESAADATARLLDGLALHDDFTQEEVANAARYLVQVGPLSNETAADIARQVASLAAVGLGADFVNQHRAALASVTAEDVNRAWRSAIRPEALTVAIGGPAEILEPRLRAAGIHAEPG